MLRSFAQKAKLMNTARALRWDLTRAKARRRTGAMLRSYEQAHGSIPKKLHFGSGNKKIAGWLNCDVMDSDVDIDLVGGTLPFADGYFEAAAAQQVIEHIQLEEELQPLLAELHRCMAPGAELWLSCPDMEKVCRSYMEDGGDGLIADKRSRWPNYDTKGYYKSHVVNDLFHQFGQHKNLFDLPLLTDVLTKAGFRDVTRRQEADWLERWPEFIPRKDDFHALYVSAIK